MKERGWKCRVVTKSPLAEIHLGHCLRKFLFRGLRKDKHVSLVVSGQHRRAVEKILSKVGTRPNRRLLSADLTSATDLFPLDLVQALVRGLLKARGESRATPLIPEHFRRVMELLTGPQYLSWPSLGKKEVTKRGILMGLPTTWTLLNLVQLVWCGWSAR